MLHSPDDHDFEEIYRSIPAGLTIIAARSEHSEALRSFCFSLKGAAIRRGSNAMFFRSQYSKRNWLDKGIQHFRSFVEKHSANSVRIFLIDQPTGYADRKVAQVIQEYAESIGISVIMTTVAHHREQGDEKWLATLDGGIQFCFPSAISLRRRSSTRLVPLTQPVPLELPTGEKAILRVTTVKNVPEDQFYYVTTIMGGQETHYGPLCFLEVCPQPPDSQGQGGKTEA